MRGSGSIAPRILECDDLLISDADRSNHLGRKRGSNLVGFANAMDEVGNIKFNILGIGGKDVDLIPVA